MKMWVDEGLLNDDEPIVTQQTYNFLTLFDTVFKYSFND